ncbi:MAG: YIP1 family protein [Bacteroidales bacterium]|nr:YIP1 family protein [Bacteroidales bacterium]
MDFNQIFVRTKGIIMNPESEWQTISSETSTSKEVFTGFVLPYLVIGFISSVIGAFLFSNWIFIASVASALVSLIVYIIVLFITPMIIEPLGKSFATEVNRDKAFKLLAYSFTPSYVINIVIGILPILGILGIVGLYGIYIMWVGFSKLFNTPEDKKVGFFIVTLLIIIGEMVILSLILGSIILFALGMGGGYYLFR